MENVKNEILKNISLRKKGLIDFKEVEMNLRADLVMEYGYDIDDISMLSDYEVYELIDNEEYPVEADYFNCQTCNTVVEVTENGAESTHDWMEGYCKTCNKKVRLAYGY